jgi:hypothetical protein
LTDLGLGDANGPEWPERRNTVDNTKRQIAVLVATALFWALATIGPALAVTTHASLDYVCNERVGSKSTSAMYIDVWNYPDEGPYNYNYFKYWGGWNYQTKYSTPQDVTGDSGDMTFDAPDITWYDYRCVA